MLSSNSSKHFIEYWFQKQIDISVWYLNLCGTLALKKGDYEQGF